MIRNLRVIIGMIMVLVFTAECNNKNRLLIEKDVPEIEVEVLHLDKILFDKKDKERQTYTTKMAPEEFGLFREYVEDIMRVSAVDDPYMWKKLNEFINEPNWNALQQSVDSVFYPFTSYQNEWSKAMSLYKYHFPKDTVPLFYTYNSGYNYGVFPTKKSVGIGLEWYVGSNNKMVQQLPYDMFPNYMKRHMEPDYMVVDAVKGWLLVKHFDESLLEANFLENLIFYGKVMYYLEACFPEYEQWVKMGFSEEQTKWVNSNLENIWATVVKNNLLFDKDKRKINQWFLDAPFTAGLPNESPGKVGVWLGFNMVKQYMDKNDDVSLQQLNGVKPESILKNFKPN